MEYQVELKGAVVEIKINGRLTFAEHHLCRPITDEMNEAKATQCLVDLSDVEFIDSAGLGLLLLLRENAAKNNRTLSLRIPQEGQVRRMLDVAHFGDLMDIVL